MTSEMSGGRDPFSRYRDQLSAVGFKPSTTRGQNFLLDPSLHRWIAEQAGPTEADTVIEIGVGLGFLTRELAQRAGRLLAVEIEPRLLAIAQRELSACANIEWLEADALGGVGERLCPRIAEVAEATEGRLLVVANLPYSVSGPLLAELAQLRRTNALASCLPCHVERRHHPLLGARRVLTEHGRAVARMLGRLYAL